MTYIEQLSASVNTSLVRNLAGAALLRGIRAALPAGVSLQYNTVTPSWELVQRAAASVTITLTLAVDLVTLADELGVAVDDVLRPTYNDAPPRE